MKNKGKSMPSLRSDEAVDRFVATADLSEYDLSGFKPMRFEISRKESALSIRIPTPLMDAVRSKAKSKDIPYARYVRMVLEADIARA